MDKKIESCCGCRYHYYEIRNNRLINSCATDICVPKKKRGRFCFTYFNDVAFRVGQKIRVCFKNGYVTSGTIKYLFIDTLVILNNGEKQYYYSDIKTISVI